MDERVRARDVSGCGTSPGANQSLRARPPPPRMTSRPFWNKVILRSAIAVSRLVIRATVVGSFMIIQMRTSSWQQLVLCMVGDFQKSVMMQHVPGRLLM